MKITRRDMLAVQGLDVHFMPGPEFGEFIDRSAAGE